MKKFIPLLALTLTGLPLPAQVDYDGNYPWSQTTSFAPDAAVPGWFYNLGITGLRVQLDPAAPRTLVVKHVLTDTPADPSGSTVHLRAGDVITGVEGQPFTEDHQDGYGPEVFGARGPIREFGIALDAAQGTDGLLSVTRLRNGTTTTRTLNVGTTYGSFSPTWPVNCPKSDLILSQLLTYLRQTQNAAGYWEGVGGHENHIFAGLALLSDGSAESMTAAGKLATYYKNETTTTIPPDGLYHWKYLAAAIYLSEYYHKTNDATIPAKLNSIYNALLASQYTNVSQIVPGYHGIDPFNNGFGGWGHNPGYEGYGPIAMLTGQGALAFSLMNRVGVNVNRNRLDAAYAFLVKGTGANKYVWYADQDGSSGNPAAWADPGRTGAAAIASWMSPYPEPVYKARAVEHARFMGDHPQSFPDTHGSPTIGMAYAAMGTHVDPASFRKLLDDNLWWFSLSQTPEGNFYYQPNRDNAGYGASPRFQASSVTALILSLPKRNLMISEDVFEMTQGSFSSPPTAAGTTAISMTATTVTTANGPVEYLFTETSGNPGGTTSSWQISPNYTDTGLSFGTQYSYTVSVRDALGIAWPASAAASATTQQGSPPDLMSLNFSAFTEITNATTPGNYIISRGLRNPSLTLRVWGNGFNHIGPSGFQIVKDSSGVIPSGPAGNPDPSSGSLGHAPGTDLSWNCGLDATSRNVYFGTNPTPGAAEFRGNQTATTYDPGNLASATYYWRIDEINPDGTTQGPVWSFSVGPPAKAFRPMPWNGMTAVATDVGTLKWVAGESATASSNDVYFGTDSTPDASEVIGNQSGTTYNPGVLSPGTTYYWRIDQVNAQGTATGDVWSFTTPNTGTNKVKIFIMAGQSNMEGQGEMNPAGTPGTLQTIFNNDPVTYAHLKSGGNWTVRDDAWIWCQREGTTLVHGGLTAGYEIAGFAWHQGWNDRVTPAFAAEYEANMARFIRDVRSSVGVPRMPFVIASTGMDGNPDYSEVELAQLQMKNFATDPDFNGNVAVVDTQSFWFPSSQSPADQGYHWNRNAGSYYQIGKSIAQEMKTLLESGSGGGDNTPPSPNPMTWASVPAALGSGGITMSATTASDPNGVAYFFDETSNKPGGSDSGWQDSANYTDTVRVTTTPGPTFVTVDVKLKDTLAPNGRLFARLKATINP